jgi:hypothetical protein
MAIRVSSRAERSIDSSLWSGARLAGETGAAEAENGEVAEVCLKAKFVVKSRGEAIEVRVVQGADVAAGAADNVMVAIDADPLELALACTHVSLTDKAEGCGGIEGAVNGGGVDVGIGAADVVEDV